ncbi:MAG: helix-turn-helix domain-containing protein [Anaerolineae bacterium]|nr:helix-turn-helix domain-containing protein [Anaerolineae bacterium]MDW8298309.1 helix-turn-helix domain-containing protein [Anaerolineae bacterium]
MSDSRPVVTVQDMLRHTMPVGTRIVAGRDGVTKPISWVAVLHTRPPAFPSLEGRELALLSIDALHLLSDKLTLAAIIHDLAQVDVAALGVVGTIDPAARKAAESYGIPLLNLPDGTVLRQLERDCVRLLVGTPPSPEERGRAIHEQLLQLSTANRGLRAVIAALADLSGLTIVVQDKRLDILTAVGELVESPNFAAIEAALRDPAALPTHFLDRHQAAQHADSPALIHLPEHNLQRLTVPIVANRLGRGFFSLMAESQRAFEPLDGQFLRHGAAVCALEMAKEKAIREAQKRVQGSLLERLLLGNIPLDQALRQLTRLGYQPNDKPYAALAACWTGENVPSDRRLETTFNEQVALLGSQALVQLMESGVVVFCQAEQPQSTAARKVMPRAVRQLAEAVLSRLRAQFPQAHLAVGVGRPAESLAQWRTSYQEATAAQRIAAQWRVHQPLYFADLGVYRLLSLLLETPELRSFYRETLGELADESPSNGDFIQTLEVFFEEHGNLSQTASRLHVHRNTLLYRMERIAQLGGFDLDNPETRLAVHLALKIRRLLQS